MSPMLNLQFQKAKIRFGLSAVKNVGDNFINVIIKAREAGKFKGFTDFIERIEKVDPTVMNKRAVESLIKCGAMDSLGARRAQLLAIFEKTIDRIHSNRKRNLEGQFSIFDRLVTEEYRDDLPDVAEFNKEPIAFHGKGNSRHIYIRSSFGTI